MFTPGQFLKAIALGADAVYLGSAVLFTVSHKQVLNAVPFEPPTQVVWYDGKYKDDFNRQEGAKALVNYFNASVKEMEEGIRMMGKKHYRSYRRMILWPMMRVLPGILMFLIVFVRMRGALRRRRSR